MSIFKMEQVHEISRMPVTQAKAYLLEIIETDEVSRPVTKNKARNMINRATTTTKLTFAMSNWILAHPSESLKVIR